MTIRNLILGVMFAMFGALAAPAASAGDPQIDAAKSQGVVGERIDGYLGIVSDSTDASLRRKVQEINAKRRAVYDKLAAETGTRVEDVATLTGEEQIAGASKGEYYMDSSGSWKQK